MIRKLMVLGIAVLAMPSLSYVASAECPEGKVAVTIATPSGKEKQLCVSDDAVHGIENAAEHSGTTIIPSTCPCWTLSELELVASRDPDFTCAEEPPSLCVPGTIAPFYSCATTSDPRLFVLGGICGTTSLACENRFSLDPITKSPLAQEQYDACLATFERFWK